MRSRGFITLFTSALLLSASLFLAPAAFAAPDTCDKIDPFTEADKFASSGSETFDGGLTGSADDASVNWSGTTLNYSVPEGGILQICIKAGAEQSDGGTATYTIDTISDSATDGASGSISTSADLAGHGISHVALIYSFSEPEEPETVTATASIGDVDCGDTSVDVTLGSDGTSDFTVTVGSITENFTGVTGSGNVESIDLSSLGDGDYTVTVSSADLGSDETKVITLESDCGSVVRSASITGSCAAGATAHLRGAPGDVFTVTVGGTAHEVTLGESGTANPKYALPENAETEVSVAGAATAVRTFDCTVEVENVVNERPVDNTTDPVDPVVVADDDEVEVKPQVLEREELAFTGDYEDRLLVIALAFLGLGLPLTLVTPRRQRVDAR